MSAAGRRGRIVLRGRRLGQQRQHLVVGSPWALQCLGFYQFCEGGTYVKTSFGAVSLFSAGVHPCYGSLAAFTTTLHGIDIGRCGTLLYSIGFFHYCRSVQDPSHGSLAVFAGAPGSRTLVGRSEHALVWLVLPSGTARAFSRFSTCWADTEFIPENPRLFRAGQHYHLGQRPLVRRRAMNAIDRPHGCRRLMLP
jgi:hypothetical protein